VRSMSCAVSVQSDMKRLIVFTVVSAALSLMPFRAMALSESLREPSIFFPKGFDTNRSAKVLAVLRSTNNVAYLGGLTSYWEPKFETTLVYQGEPSQLRAMIAGLDGIEGMRVHITYSENLSRETGSALQAGSWWVTYSHTMPNTISIRVNRAAKGFDNQAFEARAATPAAP
jgi:hypothetical protein